MNNKNGKVRRAVIYLLLLAGGATGLKDVKIKVPPMVRSGESALLTCTYDLEGADLYTIKWYREDVEFYRFVPKEAPPHAVFPVHGIKIDVSKSNRQNVKLVNVSRELTGFYKCEVSADAPSYHTEIKEAQMMVVDVPETNVTIVAERQRLPEETLRVNCTSGASRPAPVIRWTLNGNPLNNSAMKYEVQSYTVTHGEMKMTQAILELKTSSNGLFQDGRLFLRCFAEIPHVYREYAELELSEDAPLIASITRDASAHSHQSNGCDRVNFGKTSGLVVTLLASFLLPIVPALR